ncbi:hypothetical protein KIPB_012561 [Kipferlia bialata]|uniref:Uncharacterized protein n=1 Tax=Kipferlia bialata TaxID=797122 RepID=A0A9K3GPI2_9EUKA|nr:hypothetical protein KIPB_012561 [Kipferlia bialata]|eukprot:g12561.t1
MNQRLSVSRTQLDLDRERERGRERESPRSNMGRSLSIDLGARDRSATWGGRADKGRALSMSTLNKK